MTTDNNTPGPQRIIRFEVEDWLRVRKAKLKPNGKAMVIGGPNESGKSSLLRAIEAACKKGKPEESVRKGAKKAQILLETTDYVIEKVVRASGTHDLELRSKAGGIIPRPHELLAKLWDDLTFDPCAFERMKPTEQAEMLRQLVGLDFAKENAAHKETFEKRTEVGREIKRLEGALASLPDVPSGTPVAELSVADLVAEAERRQKINDDHAAKRRDLGALRAKGEQDLEVIARCEQAVADAKRMLAATEEKLASASTAFEETKAKGKALRAEVDALKDEDIAEVRGRIATAEKTNAAVRASKERVEKQAELDKLIEQSEALTQRLAEIDSIKADAATKAKYPITGLEVTDEGVRLDGFPFANASQAKRLRASTAIGAAMKQGLRCMLIREGAFLDEKSMALLLGPIAEEFDLQPIVEVVGDRKEVTVLMSDGEVAEDRTGKSEGAQEATAS